MIPLPYIGGGALLLGVLGGWTIRDWKADSDEAEAKEAAFTQYKALTETLADQSLAYEVLAQGLRGAERRDRETIREIHRDKIIPTACAADPAAARVLTEAVTRANASAAGELSGEVP